MRREWDAGRCELGVPEAGQERRLARLAHSKSSKSARSPSFLAAGSRICQQIRPSLRNQVSSCRMSVPQGHWKTMIVTAGLRTTGTWTTRSPGAGTAAPTPSRSSPMGSRTPMPSSTGPSGSARPTGHRTQAGQTVRRPSSSCPIRTIPPSTVLSGSRPADVLLLSGSCPSIRRKAHPRDKTLELAQTLTQCRDTH